LKLKKATSLDGLCETRGAKRGEKKGRPFEHQKVSSVPKFLPRKAVDGGEDRRPGGGGGPDLFRKKDFLRGAEETLR